MERSPSHNTAIKFHQGSLHTDSPVRCKKPQQTTAPYYHTGATVALLSPRVPHNTIILLENNQCH